MNSAELWFAAWVVDVVRARRDLEAPQRDQVQRMPPHGHRPAFVQVPLEACLAPLKGVSTPHVRRMTDALADLCMNLFRKSPLSVWLLVASVFLPDSSTKPEAIQIRLLVLQQKPWMGLSSLLSILWGPRRGLHQFPRQANSAEMSRNPKYY